MPLYSDIDEWQVSNGSRALFALGAWLEGTGLALSIPRFCGCSLQSQPRATPHAFLPCMGSSVAGFEFSWSRSCTFHLSLFEKGLG